MTYIPDKIRVSMTEKVYNDYCREASTHATRKHLRVECNICGQSMQAAFLQHHLELQHDVYHSFVLNRDLEGECLPATFQADEDTKTGSNCCPVPGCCGGSSGHPSGGVAALPMMPQMPHANVSRGTQQRASADSVVLCRGVFD
ncbi:hypothetical protein ACHAXH_000219 [Discostella pseudostelligera]